MFLALVPHLIAPLSTLQSVHAVLKAASTATTTSTLPPSLVKLPLQYEQKQQHQQQQQQLQKEEEEEDLFAKLSKATVSAPLTLSSQSDPAEADLIVRLLIQSPVYASRLSIPESRIIEFFVTICQLHATLPVDSLIHWLSAQPSFSSLFSASSSSFPSPSSFDSSSPYFSTETAFPLNSLLQVQAFQSALEHLSLNKTSLRASDVSLLSPVAVVWATIGSAAAVRLLKNLPNMPLTSHLLWCALFDHGDLLSVVMEKSRQSQRQWTLRDEVLMVRWCCTEGWMGGLVRLIRLAKADGRQLWQWIEGFEDDLNDDIVDVLEVFWSE